jgi:hypothetical protein
MTCGPWRILEGFQIGTHDYPGIMLADPQVKVDLYFLTNSYIARLEYLHMFFFWREEGTFFLSFTKWVGKPA